MSAENSLRLERWTQVLVVVLASGALLVLWSAFLSTTMSERQRAEDADTLRLVRTARLFAANLDHLLGESRLAFELLKASAGSHPGVDPATSREFATLVHSVRSLDHGDLDLKAIGRNGRLVTFDSGPEVYVTDREYLAGALAPGAPNPYLGRPVLSRLSGHWILAVTTPLAPGSGTLEALQVGLDYATFDRMFLALRDAGDEAVEVYRDDGALLYAYPRAADFWPQTAPEWWLVQAEGQPSGVLGSPRRAFQQGSEAGFWVVTSRASSSEWSGEAWFRVQAVWMGILTLVFVFAGASLLAFQSRLKTLRLAQEDLGRVDPLTGLLNRRAFLERCTVERLRTDRNPAPLSLVLLDLDHFKDVNDTFGHQVGDQALRDFGAALVRTLRATDVLARMGGEEFAVLLPGTDGPQAREITERLRAEVESVGLPEGHLTTSIGLAVWDAAETFDSWYHRADRALYRAKAEGRNRVCEATSSQ